ncbi:hypothetical protein EW145_g2016 [Phellinidium pouzarii]|uniref:Protein kinase domain-containing protein n=1 Tax=Phellinidium pouzarii TaxID=167371 RepID=A0A4S4LHY0_9AGAM|nr:hypothetical protein EW145_g2016 [Phellinidium pouzarii]
MRIPINFILHCRGATCSGKTTLAKHLRQCIPNSIIIHQDDFAPPQELVPIHPEYNVQDWDDAPGAIDWPRLRSFLKEVKQTGAIPDSHKSHDHLNEQKNVPLSDNIFGQWRSKFEDIANKFEENGENVIWGLVDGFLLYWDEEVFNALDARIFLRVRHDILKKRRHERHGYHTAVQSDPEGTLWRDPPQYFERIVYPAYVRAHERVFSDGDVEAGASSGFVQRLTLIESDRMSMDEMFEKAYNHLNDPFLLPLAMPSLFRSRSHFRSHPRPSIAFALSTSSSVILSAIAGRDLSPTKSSGEVTIQPDDLDMSTTATSISASSSKPESPPISDSIPLDGITSVIVQTTKLTAAAVPVPWIGPAVELVAAIAKMCKNVSKNRHAATTLAEHCKALLVAVQDCNGNPDLATLKKMRSELESLLENIRSQMEKWAELQWFKAFVQQETISLKINSYHVEIDSFCKRYTIIAHAESVSWQAAHSIQSKADHDELKTFLSDLANTNELENKCRREEISALREDFEAFYRLVQTLLLGLRGESEQIEQVEALEKNLSAIYRSSGTLPPDIELTEGLIQKERDPRFDSKNCIRAQSATHACASTRARSKILIDESGDPLLSEFGMMRIVESDTAEPMDPTSLPSSLVSIRWRPLELLFPDDSEADIGHALTTNSDIFMYAMTVLELMTGERPFPDIRTETRLLIYRHKKGKPRKPQGLAWETLRRRGLDDRLWELLERCWADKPKDRPSITEPRLSSNAVAIGNEACSSTLGKNREHHVTSGQSISIKIASFKSQGRTIKGIVAANNFRSTLSQMFLSLSPFPKSRSLERPRSLPHLKPSSFIGNDPMNIRSATSLSIAEYHSRQAKLFEHSSPERSERGFVSSSERSLPSSSRRLSLSVPRSSTSWNTDDTRPSRSTDVHTPLSGRGRSSSLKKPYNPLGDAPASPPIRWDAYDVTSVESAADLLQRVASHHDVDRSVQAVRNWLKSLPWLDGANREARIYIRAEVMDHFLHVWHPQSQKKSHTFNDKAEPSLVSIKLLDALHHANVLKSTDIALAAEFLFKHRLRTGYMHALYELISTAGERASRHGVLNRMSALAEELKRSKKSMTCQDVKLQARLYPSILKSHCLTLTTGAGTVSVVESTVEDETVNKAHLAALPRITAILWLTFRYLILPIESLVMRWSLCIATAILIFIPVFSSPIPRFLLRRRGLFEDTLQATGTTINQLAAEVTNALTDDPAPCAHVKSFFQQLAAGESAGGVTTIGDRAVAGARKMLGLQSAGTAGLVQMVNELVDGTLSNSTTIALVQAVSMHLDLWYKDKMSEKDLVSFQTAPGLLAGLTNLTNGVGQLNGTGLKPLQDLVNQIQPVLASLEDTIDQFGADFSSQQVANQTSDIQKIISLVEDGNGNVQKLKGLNKENQQTVNTLIDAAQDSMNQLAAAAQEASSAANAPPDIPPDQFTYRKGTSCTAD